MIRIPVASFFLLFITAVRAEKFCYPFLLQMWNPRVGEHYSTWVEEDETIDARASLTSVGNKIKISPLDSFYFAPEIGYGIFDKSRQEFYKTTEVFEEPVALVISSGLDNETKDWAKEKLNKDVDEYVVPMPKSNLVDMDLTIVSSKPIVKKQDMVLCHEIERGSYGCHKTDEVDITEVTVSPETNGKEDVLWVACHEGKGCHVMNVSDKAFVFMKQETKKLNLRNNM